MAICNVGGHRCAQTPVAWYFVTPGNGTLTGDRFRSRLCIKHGRELLHTLYRRGLDLLSEGEEPELCIGCGQPGNQWLLEMAVYEGDWAARFACVVCATCDCTDPSTVVEALVGHEKLPRRENMTKRTNGRR